ncbi:TPA: fimbrial protein [Enterobacter ludwigii]
MKKLFCLAALTTVLGLAASQAAMAATTVNEQTGQVQFDATVQASTCTLSGQDMTHDLGAFSATDAWATTAHSTLKQVSDTINVTACPDSVSKVLLTPTWGGTPNADKKIANNQGGAAHVEMVVSSDAAGTKSYSSTTANTFNVLSNAVDIPFIQTYRHDNTPTAATAGTLQFSATLKFEYQ